MSSIDHRIDRGYGRRSGLRPIKQSFLIITEGVNTEPKNGLENLNLKLSAVEFYARKRNFTRWRFSSWTGSTPFREVRCPQRTL